MKINPTYFSKESLLALIDAITVTTLLFPNVCKELFALYQARMNRPRGGSHTTNITKGTAVAIIQRFQLRGKFVELFII